ncbi:MAG: NAD(P)-dependent oxidoreductase [Planctomycetota bacterium]
MQLLLLDPGVGTRQRIETEIPGIDWLDSSNPRESLARAEVVFGLLKPEYFELAHGLKWLQLPIAGVTPELCDWASKRQLLLTNVRGIYNQTVGEHCLALMLALARRLDLLFHQQASRDWLSPKDPPIRDLSGTTVAILGTGNIGRGIARLCQGFGMRVLGCRRTPKQTPFVDQFFPPRKFRW